jgi:hypothetical protein
MHLSITVESEPSLHSDVDVQSIAGTDVSDDEFALLEAPDVSFVWQFECL